MSSPKIFKFVTPISLGAVFCALCDWFSVPASSLATLEIGLTNVIFPILLIGNLFFPALVAQILLHGVETLFSYAAARSRSRIFVAAALVAIAVSPYSIWLSLFTFSGPQMTALAIRPILVGAMAVSVSLCFAIWAMFGFFLKNTHKLSIAWIILQLAASYLGSQINREVYPNEYEPLHVFVGIWTMLLAIGASRHFVDLLGDSGARGRRIATGAFFASVLLAGTTSVVLANDQFMAALVWSDTATSRYTTIRLKRGEEMSSTPVSYSVGESKLLQKNEYDRSAVAAMRKEGNVRPKPNIVLFWIDNIQAGHMGIYGYKANPTTPHIDKLAGQGVVFENAYSSFPQTRNFTTSLLWGRFVFGFRVHSPNEKDVKYSIAKQLGALGYHIYVETVFEEGGAHGFDPKIYGIDTYARYRTGAVQEREVVQSVVTHLAEAKSASKPAFIWIHLYRPHWKDRTRFDDSKKYSFGSEIRDKYDSAIAQSDWVFSRVRNVVENHGSSRENIWIVGSDHGAGIDRFDHDIGKSLYNEHVHVPLIIVAPGIKPGRISNPVDASLDVAATLLDLVGITPPSYYEGISLLPQMREPRNFDRAIVLNYGKNLRGIVTKRWKLIVQSGTVRLFDLSAESFESRNVANVYPKVVKRLIRILKIEESKRMEKAKGI